MTMITRLEYLKRMKIDYLHTQSRPDRTRLLNQIEKTTGLNRKYLIMRLAARISLEPNVTISRKPRKPQYNNTVVYYLKKLWDVLDCPCGQRMVGAIPDTLDALVRHGEICLSSEMRETLLNVSASTIDRKLKRWKKGRLRRLHGTTKPGSLLGKHIPISLSRWNETELGFSEIDLCAHNGGNPLGEFANTFVDTDLASGWTEQEAFLGKSEKYVILAIAAIDGRRPFARRGIDSDNGSEFINWHLWRFCCDHDVAFSRGRPNHKNDNAHVEQKNWTHVRKLVGYHRYDNARQVNLLNNLYRNEWRLYENFFQPTLKLEEKKRVGGHLHRIYGIPKTPYQRIMESNAVPATTKARLKKRFESLNPAALKHAIEHKLHAILATTKHRKHYQPFVIKSSSSG